MSETQPATDRLFIAFEVPTDVKERLADVIGRLKSECVRVGVPSRAIKWVDAHTIHLTTQFLGDTPRRDIENIRQALSDVHADSVHTDSVHANSDRAPFTLQSRTTGAFPNLHRPRVIWCDLAGADLTRMKNTVETITNRLIALNFPLDRKPFKPHLTLGRIRRDTQPFSLQPIVVKTTFEPIVITFTSLTLFKSKLTREGSIHTPVQTWSFVE